MEIPTPPKKGRKKNERGDGERYMVERESENPDLAWEGGGILSLPATSSGPCEEAKRGCGGVWTVVGAEEGRGLGGPGGGPGGDCTSSQCWSPVLLPAKLFASGQGTGGTGRGRKMGRGGHLAREEDEVDGRMIVRRGDIGTPCGGGAGS